ncbi:uncharacterized protein RCC_10425 [Ramularia collo-cygni]|uniref:Aminoglycoside phosphotransferase domain-containing protein n=1 Tax=Ramularia collo-cygni TaxID=112498 RepID=A0A2D3VR21_9PEZI|nr:uncharacterized protein RCC_10425 [Ramularia collo-cygni]CZT24698.1 uncharacterized protein RCC_10425 [Ramularia collo-cygni]
MSTVSNDDVITVANQLLDPLDLEATSYHTLQQLWSGYGTIARLQTVSKTSPISSALILKHVTPPSDAGKDEGHLRKLISYQVEQYFYTTLAPLMPKSIGVAICLTSQWSDAGGMAMVLSDLRNQYPVPGEKRGNLDQSQVYAALQWLGTFHGFWWRRTKDIKAKGLRLPPLEEADCSPSRKDGVWRNGGYTYLATRRTEYATLKNDKTSEWSEKLCAPALERKSSIAELVADVLSPSTSHSSVAAYETLIHGDVKSENLFANSMGSKVAFFDFQYVGLGLGVCDLAKLFTCSVPSELLGANDGDMSESERVLLDYYMRFLEETSGKTYPWALLEMHWKTALVDWLRFQASWGFWGNTAWLESRVRHILEDAEWNAWLLKEADAAKN